MSLLTGIIHLTINLRLLMHTTKLIFVLNKYKLINNSIFLFIFNSTIPVSVLNRIPTMARVLRENHLAFKVR